MPPATTNRVGVASSSNNRKATVSADMAMDKTKEIPREVVSI